ncbi:MAG TPA: hypothetical protein VI636_12060 [Candidatus Angelobacter sp.]
MKSFKFKDLMVNVAPSAERPVGGCGFFTPCPNYTCDFGNTHPTRPFAEQARVAAFGCGFGYTCNYGTYCGFSIEPCGYTCDFGNTHPTRPFAVEEQARVAGAAQPAAAQTAMLPCPAHTVAPCLHFTGGCGFTNCHFYTCFGCTIAVTRLCGPGLTFIACQAGTCAATCGFTGDPGTPVYQGDPEGIATQLAAVKAQLQQELAAVETQERAVAEVLKPQTAAEVEELQGKLRDAIAELDKQKQELHKKSDKPSKK